MRILGIIPARGGSKGVPKKNIKKLGEKPLIEYTINSCKVSKLLTNYIVSTDCDQTISLCNNLNVDVPFKRPKALALDSTPSIEVVKHAVEFFEKREIKYDAICLLQPTTPFREINFIDNAINKFIHNNSDSLVSVIKVPKKYNPNWVLHKTEDKLKFFDEEKLLTRRQNLEDTFIRDGSIYLTKVNLIKKGTFYSKSIDFVVNQSEVFINIDEKADWLSAEKLLSKYKGT